MSANSQNGDVRIGFCTCHCGQNVASLVDCPAVAPDAGKLPGAVMSRDCK